MKITIFVLTFLFSFQSFSESSFNIKDRLKTQDFYLKTYPHLFGSADYALEGDFKNVFKNLKKRKRKKITAFIKKVEAHIPSKILRPFVYWYFIKDEKSKASQILEFFFLYKLVILRDHIDNPLALNRAAALKLLQKITERSDINTQNLFSMVMPDISSKVNLIMEQGEDSLVESLFRTPLTIIDFKKTIPSISPYALSYLGIIPGNNVEIISKNDISLERIEWFNERVIFNGGRLDFNAPYINMPTAENPSGHIVFKQDPIYQKISTMISEAKDSIFIDIFLFGGTLGATLTEYLLDQTIIKAKANPNFKVLLLHDYATNYNMVDEMMPIFEYIQKRVASEEVLKERVMLMQANIQRHPPGIPFGITNLIPKTEEVFSEIEKRNTYYESKIDHSKVIVVDANTDNPQAYFGSKNWTDHSGGYYYDNAIYVNGPGAAMVQASYYTDVEAALTLDKKEQAWFFYKDKGFDNKKYLKRRDSILEWFKIKKDSYSFRGEESIRLAEANVDGKIKNVRNILIDMIKDARKHIYMEQLFIYDKYIVDALIKKKVELGDKIDIKILADHNGNFGLNGLPNTIFIKEMIDSGIELRARKTYGVTAHFPNGTEQEYHQENHRKISSVDGVTLLGGSSNLNPDTLQGSFREFGAQIYSTEEIKTFEDNFIADWNSPEKVESLDIENFQAKVAGKTLPISMSALINDLAAMILRAKDRIERRY